MTIEVDKKYYSDSKFWKKINTLPNVKPFCTVMSTAIALYLLLKDSSVSSIAKTSIVLALAYFICPVDIIPDIVITPLGAGFVDDMVVMGALLASLQSSLTEKIKRKIQNLLPDVCKNSAENE